MDPCECDVQDFTENKTLVLENETLRVSAFPFGKSSTLGLSPWSQRKQNFALINHSIGTAETGQKKQNQQ